VPDTSAPRAADLVQRRLTPSRPDRLWVADFTYGATWSGTVYVAFVLDAYSRGILGWRATRSMKTALVFEDRKHSQGSCRDVLGAVGTGSCARSRPDDGVQASRVRRQALCRPGRGAGSDGPPLSVPQSAEMSSTSQQVIMPRLVRLRAVCLLVEVGEAGPSSIGADAVRGRLASAARAEGYEPVEILLVAATDPLPCDVWEFLDHAMRRRDVAAVFTWLEGRIEWSVLA